jgi:TetR/AcrR family acrAB operon transcriptional repressor
MNRTTKRRQQALATRDKILDGAELEFFRRGVDRTSLDDIANAAGMTRGAIYGHFANKSVLLSALFERAALPWDPFTVPLRSADSSSIELLRTDLEVLVGDVLQSGTKRRLYGIMFSFEWSEECGVVSRATLSEANRFARTRIEAALSRAVNAQEVCGSIDIVDEASLIHACLTGYFHRSLFDTPVAGTEGRLAARIVEHIFRPLTSASSL